MDAVAALVCRARAAQRAFGESGQRRLDLACLAAARTVMEPARNRRLSEMAVADTDLGVVADKIDKNRRKTLGLLRDIRGQISSGVVAEYPARGLIEIARPVGVIAAITPSTNPVATPINNIINALKGGNAVVLAPSPKGAAVCEALVGEVRGDLARLDFPPDLVQMLPRPPSRDATAALLAAADLAVATGSQANVREAHIRKTPAIGVGVGNAPVIIDETADAAAAARLICRSKTFDNATSCSSENSAVIVAEIYDRAIAALAAEGGVMLSAAQKAALQKNLWDDGKLNRDLIARDFAVLAAAAGLPPEQAGKFLMVCEDGVGPDFPFSGEKMSVVLTVYRAADFDDAAGICGEILRHQGCGHSVGIHTKDEKRPLRLGLTLPAGRVIVNQAHCFATGGAFDNGLPFSLSMGCGAWGGNNIGGNLTFRHFLNTALVARPIPADIPAEADIFADYFAALPAES